uniref:Sulfotransferase n=1 Tax=Gouania willdenowi TaxID=441366 RepID=A0A8C5HWR8_GOUWI
MDYSHQEKKPGGNEDMKTSEYIDSLQSFDIRDSDVFIVTYPKSGTIWTQQVVISVCELDGGLNQYQNNLEQMPWLEYTEGRADYSLRPSPRLFASHLTPTEGREGQGEVIYVMRNPKDNIVSYYNFSSKMTDLETPKNFEQFLDQYLKGDGETRQHSWQVRRKQGFMVEKATFKNTKKDPKANKQKTVRLQSLSRNRNYVLFFLSLLCFKTKSK